MGTCQCLAQTEFPIFAFFFFQSGNHWANQGFSHSDLSPILLYCMVSISLPLWIGLPWAWWKACLCIRSFHSSITNENSPSVERFTFPLDLAWTPRNKTGVGPPMIWCAERKAGVGAVRDHWNDLPLDVWAQGFWAIFFNSYWYHLLLGWLDRQLTYVNEWYKVNEMIRCGLKIYMQSMVFRVGHLI